MSGDRFYTFRGYEIMRQDQKILTPSMEDYLEMIYRYSIEKGNIRINVLANLLNVQTPSASKTVRRLHELGFIKYEGYGIVALTSSGSEVGAFLLNRHREVYEFLNNLGVVENLLMDTEMIEHNISMETLGKVELFNEFCRVYPSIKEKFIR